MSKKTPQIVKEIRNYQYPEVDYRYQKSISYSQLQMYRQCPHKWDLNYPQKKVCRIVTLGGQGMDEWVEQTLEILEEWSIEQDCDAMETVCRKGFVKKLKNSELDWRSGRKLPN